MTRNTTPWCEYCERDVTLTMEHTLAYFVTALPAHSLLDALTAAHIGAQVIQAPHIIRKLPPPLFEVRVQGSLAAAKAVLVAWTRTASTIA